MVMLLALACAGSETGTDASGDLPESCEEAEATALIGTGEYEWEDLLAGDPVTMIHGPQGGWHILGSVRLANLFENVEIHYTITDLASGLVVSDNDYFVQQVSLGACSGEVIGRYGYLNHYEALVEGEADTPWELLACHDVEIAMSATDTTWGKAAQATLVVVATPDQADSTDPCP
jgi:hypothetical protein